MRRGSAASVAIDVMLVLLATTVQADGTAVTNIYLPYVQPLEKELEYRVQWQRDSTARDADQRIHWLGLGGAMAERWYGEATLVYNGDPVNTVDAYELELLHQLTEQGEYDSDWGVLMELERESEAPRWEAALGLLNTREWQRWQFTTNLFLIREWGEKMDSEWETRLTLQGKFRYSVSLEPGFELYIGEESHFIGPFVAGRLASNGPDKLYWKLAILAGNADRNGDFSPDAILKLDLEYEFF